MMLMNGARLHHTDQSLAESHGAVLIQVKSNIGHSGLVHVKAQDDSGIWRSQQDVRIVQDTGELGFIEFMF